MDRARRIARFDPSGSSDRQALIEGLGIKPRLAALRRAGIRRHLVVDSIRIDDGGEQSL
jgi:hypothetical protein